jgi:hypothetical protein
MANPAGIEVIEFGLFVGWCPRDRAGALIPGRIPTDRNRQKLFGFHYRSNRLFKFLRPLGAD